MARGLPRSHLMTSRRAERQQLSGLPPNGHLSDSICDTAAAWAYGKPAAVEMSSGVERRGGSGVDGGWLGGRGEAEELVATAAALK